MTEAALPASGVRIPQLSAVVVHWRGEADLERLFAVWPEDPRWELVVVDNGAIEPLPAPPAGALLVRPGRNLGFAGGANLGFSLARGELLLLLNPDALPEAGALAALLAGFEQLPEAAGLAPCLSGSEGEPQHSWQLRPLPRAWQLLLQAFLLDPVRGPVEAPPATSPVAQPAAAALALRRRALERVGGLDPRFQPAWFEDVDLARRLAAAGLTVCYWPQSIFRHRQAGSVAPLGYRRFLWAYYRNLGRYLELHHGRRWALAARLLLVPGMLLRTALLPLRRPRRAPTRRAAATALLATAVGAASGWRLGSLRRGDPAAPPRPRDQRPPRPSGLSRQGRHGVPAPGAARGELRELSPHPAYAVLTVTHDSAGDLQGFMAAVARLDPPPAELVVVDCASGDGSVESARQAWPATLAGEPIALTENRGFAGGMNAALEASSSPWVLLLNPDARPRADYVGRLLALAQEHSALPVAAVTGRLVRPPSPGQPPLLDACGMRLSPTWRHLDRGSGEPDSGQLTSAQRVFGATGAASLFLRAALEDVAVEGEVFDSRFHSFREDAELCFRLRERCWEVLYQPAAVCEHRRHVTPGRRALLPAAVNYHSLKNRYLLRAYHQTWWNLLWTLPATTLRDLLALAWVLTRERSSWPAYRWLWRHRRDLLEQRRRIQQRRTASGWALDRWFLRRGLPL